MKFELQSASNFLVHLVRLRSKGTVAEPQLVKFRDSLVNVLQQRYRDHWFPEKPYKGSGFRCIRINGQMDPVIGKAGEKVGLTAKMLLDNIPGELTMWIDPREVSYRIGENGSICVLYEVSEGGVQEPWEAAKMSSSSSNDNNKKSSLLSKPSGGSSANNKLSVDQNKQQQIMSSRQSPQNLPNSNQIRGGGGHYSPTNNVTTSSIPAFNQMLSHHRQTPPAVLAQTQQQQQHAYFDRVANLPQQFHHQQQQQQIHHHPLRNQHHNMFTTNDLAHGMLSGLESCNKEQQFFSDAARTHALTIEQLAAFVSS